MKSLKNYNSPIVEIIVIGEDIVRTSNSLGGDDGELPVQPWWFEK